MGEYDFGIKLPVSKVLSFIIKPETKKFFINTRSLKGRYMDDDNDISRGIIRTNIRLFYSAENVKALDGFLETDGNNLLFIQVDRTIENFKHSFEKKELFTQEEYQLFFGFTEDDESNSVKSLYEEVRAELKNKVTSSAAAVDTLDLLYTDYKSVISSAYNAIWVSDFHRQFHSILYQIKLLIKSHNIQGSSNDSDSATIKWKWDEFQDLTNAFKQQIYHLSQSSRMFFETPNCHFRSTGQYDFLMHTYYGISKKIIEAIYLMQGVDPQSELVLLITVNTVPQVKSQLYFECGKTDEMRTINIDVPNSIIFDPYRGMGYLTHELFHYSVPASRTERNRIIGILFIGRYFYDSILTSLQNMFLRSIDNNSQHEKYQDIILSFFDSFIWFRKPQNVINNLIENTFGVKRKDLSIVFDDLEMVVLKYIEKNYSNKVENYLRCDKCALSSEYQKQISDFCLLSSSSELYRELIRHVLSYLYTRMCQLLDAKHNKSVSNFENDISKTDNLKFMVERIKYIMTNESFFNSCLDMNKNESDTHVYISDLITANYFHRMNDLIFTATKEARVDIAMISLNGMTLEDYLLFCVQCFDDNHFFGNCMADMANDEVVPIRLALVIEYFHSQERNGWHLKKVSNSQGITIGYKLADNTRKTFEKMYMWNYRAKYYKEISSYHREDSFQKLYAKCQEWIDYFEKSISNFSKHYSKFYDEFWGKIVCDCDIVRKIDSIKNDDVKERLSAIKQQFTDVHNEYKNVLEIFFEGDSGDLEYIEECSELNVKYLEQRFAQDLKTVSLFQTQKTLKELHDINDEMKAYTHHPCDNALIGDQTNDGSSDNNTRIDTEFHAYSLDDLNFYVNHCITCFNETVKKLSEPEDGSDSQELQMRNADTVWFRGETNLKYSLNPALMREYDEKKENKYGSLSKYHRSNYEEFKFRADGASEMPTGVRFTKSDYVALMQHYEIYTNFLDWTETLMTSLYFGLKYYFQYTDEELEKPENKKYKRDVCLYLFHPGLYNSFRRDILKNISDKLSGLPNAVLLSHYFTDVYSDKSFAANLIPNLSTKENEEIFDMFILGDSSFDQFYRLKKNDIAKELTDNESLKELFLPMAVWTSRLNSRIRTQSGCFVAFNLYSPQNVLTSNGGKPYDFISLMSIQDRHIPQKGQNTSDRVFLYKIVIDKDCCREVVNWLRGIGVTAETVYPELEQLKGRFN